MTLKTQLTAGALSLAVLTTATPALSAAEGPQLKDLKSRSSYAIGTQIGSNFRNQGLDIDPKVLLAAIEDALASRPPAMSEAEIKSTFTELQEFMTKNATKKGDDYLAANAKKEGVKTTASGLQYKVLKSGKGKTPKKEDTVKVHYTGTLVDGKKFDSSLDRGEPAEFPVGGVIPGWTEALLLMKEGDKFQLAIPSKIAYGESGQGPIPPNSVLLFDVELLSVEGAAK